MDGTSETVPIVAESETSDLLVAPVIPVVEVSEHQQQMNSVKDILGRPRLLTGRSVASWDMNNAITVTSGEIFDSAAFKQIQSHYEVTRFTTCLKVTVTSSALNQGAAFLAWDPRNGDSTSTAAIGFANASWCHHALLDLRENNAVTLKAPWSNTYRSLSTVTGSAGAVTGKFVLVPAVKVKGAVSDQTVSVRFQYWLEDVVLSMPRAQSKVTLGAEGEHGERVWPVEQIGVDKIVETPTLSSGLAFTTGDTIGAEIGFVNEGTGNSRLKTFLDNLTYYRCDVVYQFMAVKTPFHRGVLSLTCRGGSGAAGTDLGRKGVEWDIGQDNTMCVKIPYFFDRPMTGGSWAGVAVNVLSPLEAPDTVSDEINILCYIHAENLRVAGPMAQGWSLKCEEGVKSLLPVENELPVIGKTLDEWIKEEYRVSPNTAPNAIGDVGFRPFKFDVENAAQRSFIAFLSRFFTFYRGVAKVKVKVGLGRAINVSGADQIFSWHVPYHGGAQINYLDTLSASTGEYTPLSVNVNTAGFHRMISSGDVLEIDVHSDPGMLNPQFTKGVYQVGMSIDTSETTWPGEVDENFLYPRLILSRSFDGVFYGMAPIAP